MVTAGALRLILCVTMICVASSFARADGCILGKFGKYIPEKSQSAFIEWSAGQERLFVSTRTEPEDGPSLWLLPIPADPAKIVVEPVEKFPFVFGEQPAIAGGRAALEWCVLATLALDFPPAVIFTLALTAVGTQASAQFGPLEGVTVHQRVEKLGMVVEVLTATSASALEQYLRRRELPVRASELHGLADYFGKEFSFICGWVDQTAKVRARAMRIDFPSPAIFYPLKPTSVYSEEVDTAIYVRGFAAPAEAEAPSNFRCRCVMGRLGERDIDVKDEFWELLGQQETPRVELTRVELPRRPSEWTQDLSLLPARPPAIDAARFIERMGYRLAILVQMGVGMVAGVLLPLLCKRQDRRCFDYLYGMLAGSLVCFSILVPWLLAFGRWRERCPPDVVSATSTFDASIRSLVALTAPSCLLIVTFSAVSNAQSLFMVGGILFLLLLLWFFVWIVKAGWSFISTGQSSYFVGPLIVFALVHAIGVVALCHGIRHWLIQTT